RVHQVEWAARFVAGASPELEKLARERAGELEQAHSRVRQLTGGGQVKVHPYEPDVLGLYVLVPAGNRA
ncbi:MAG: hypothetical protein ACREU7_00990, partial [Burkholderiales bacterium]